MALDEYKPQRGGAELEDKKDLKFVGTRPDRPDGLDKVTGRARYGADINVPGMVENDDEGNPIVRHFGDLRQQPALRQRLIAGEWPWSPVKPYVMSYW